MSRQKTALMLCVLAMASQGEDGGHRPQRGSEVPFVDGAFVTGLKVSKPSVSEGYVLLAPLRQKNTFLINKDGYVVHEWKHDRITGTVAYLLPNGNLLRMVQPEDSELENSLSGGGSGGIVQEYSWEGELLWEYVMCDEKRRLHHDIERLPNGNTLMIAWVKKSKEECLAAGRDEALIDQDLYVDVIYEVKLTGKNSGMIVWEWSAWDHLVQDRDPGVPNYGIPADHPYRIDINQIRKGMQKIPTDWLHINSVAYNADRDEIMLCAHALGEIWVVSRKTGELVYRWGNSLVYGKGYGLDRRLFNHHDAHWIPDGFPGAGNIMIFNNGGGRPDGAYSSVLEITPPLSVAGEWMIKKSGSFGPEKSRWEYCANPKKSMFSPTISGAHRLKNGNTFICIGEIGTLIEVTPDGEVVWEYVNPFGLKTYRPVGSAASAGADSVRKRMPYLRNRLFRAYKYAPDYPAFIGREMIPKALLEMNGNEQ